MEQAEEAGWLAISIRKPTVGRPSRVAVKLSESQSAKLPPARHTIPIELSIRHFDFALQLTCPTTRRGVLGLQSATDAYLLSFPDAKSRAGAAASASRLRRHPMIQAARRWFLATDLHDYDEEMPPTPSAIYARLAELRREQEAGRL